ncbi:squalene--hopene cyclase [Paenibacillus nanensis]|uniref:Squalene--hopene cyclase n=2 Tax=Paenibacillus nanensis TaxID=393251 RepID=A0A3A1V6A3_9BACL|nr:squalene--hopene cyclase [Paenibacillus nanensis]
MMKQVNREIDRLINKLTASQRQDGSWHFCFENGTIIDAYVILLFRCLERNDEPLIQKLHDRILSQQQPEGCWRLYRDEEGGNLPATVEAYYALLCSGYSKPGDPAIERARAFILSHGGADKAASILTKALLSATGQRKWPLSLTSIPIEAMLIPDFMPLNLYSFSGYARVHLVPLLVMASLGFSVKTAQMPDLSELLETRGDEEEPLPEAHLHLEATLRSGTARLIGSPRSLRAAALDKAERFMLERTEADGSLYSYATSTILMVFALLALGYGKDHPVIEKACQGLKDMQFDIGGSTTLQNSPSTVWDTALLAYAMQEAGVPRSEPVIQKAAAYLLGKQHTRKGDWVKHNPNAEPGGWGFSATNTRNPDVDDTTAALRAISRFAKADNRFQDAWNRGLSWTLSMQNKDGGWPAFEKNTDNRILTWLAIDGAKSAAIDPSAADLSGRTLEFLGNYAKLDTSHLFMRRGADWLIYNQERDGSWYGRWGICYLYGTWAALTGLMAAGVSPEHEAVRKGVKWLLETQNEDGGWGESCRSDAERRYVPLGASTPSQTAWSLDALIAASPQSKSEIDRGVRRLLALLHEDDWTTDYPTGAGLPGVFYIHYHSYRYIWPLLALAHYRRKLGD